MKKRIVIINLILILYQILYPIIGNAFIEEKETTSYAAKIEYKKASNSIFSDDITYTWEYFEDEDVMPYGVLTPSNANSMEKIPMILWLHGNNTISSGALYAYSMMPIFDKWAKEKTLQPFSAYVLCPHIPIKDADRYWDSESKNVKTLLDNFIAEHNVDTNNIAIIGSSGGTFGVQYYTSSNGFPQYFSKAIIISGYYCYYGSCSVPTKAFSGYTSYGEDKRVSNYLRDGFAQSLGESNCYYVNGGHSDMSIFSRDDGYFMGLDDEESECGIER